MFHLLIPLTNGMKMQNLLPESIENDLYRGEVRKKGDLIFELLYFDYLSIYPSIKLLISFLINQYNYLFSKIK